MNGTNLYTTDVNAQTGFRPATIEEIMTGARQALSNRVKKPSRECIVVPLAEVLIDQIAAKLQDIRRRCGGSRRL